MDLDKGEDCKVRETTGLCNEEVTMCSREDKTRSYPKGRHPAEKSRLRVSWRWRRNESTGGPGRGMNMRDEGGLVSHIRVQWRLGTCAFLGCGMINLPGRLAGCEQ